VFSIAGIFIGLHQCQIGSKSLDLLVLLIKNRLDDPIADVQDKRYVDEFGEIEGNILDVMDVDFPKEVDDHVKECVQNWDMYP
jgi:hypothetical protein